MNPLQDVFISYGRADSKHFAKTLNDRLVELGYTVWFDFEDIPLGVDYQKQIDDGIEKADNFLFVIAPHSTNSDYCRLEIELALKRKKRIIPLLHVEAIDQDTWQQRNPDGTEDQWDKYQFEGLHSCHTNMHPEIGKINWVQCKEGTDDFEQSLQQVLALLELEKDYVHQHTVILNQALEWERNQKQTRYLLTGEDRQEAEAWLAVRFPDKQPPVWPTDLHYEYITESIKNSANLMTQVFLSHAEEDAAMTEKVRRSLMRSGITTWSYRADIEYGSDFEAAIARGVEQADNVLFLMSSHSLQSTYCQMELALALKLNKRLIIMLARQVEDSEIPVFLRNRQYIDLTDNETEADYLKDEDDLVRVLKQDATYHNEHKVLLAKALKWERQQRNPCILLQGYELQHALAWREVAIAKDDNGPTELQEEFIEASNTQIAAVSPDVFISYSRTDSDFARRLNNALQRQRKRTWFDQESIVSGADFQQEIYKGIETSNFFLFVLSPRAVRSQFCADEVEYAAKLNKRVVTVLHRPVNPKDLHPELAKVQWIDFTAHEGEFDTNFKELLRTLDTDPKHLKFHTQLLVKAIEWDEKGRREEVLLRGSDLADADYWLLRAAGKQPRPTELQGDYVTASRTLEETSRRRSVLRQRRVTGWLMSLLALSLGVGAIAMVKWRDADEAITEAQTRQDIALGRQLTAQASALQKEAKWTESQLLNIEALKLLQKQHVNHSDAVRALNEQRGISFWHSRFNASDRTQTSNDGQYVAMIGKDNIVRIWNVDAKEDVIKSLPLTPNGSLSIYHFSPNNRYLGLENESNAFLWDWESNKTIELPGNIKSLEFSADDLYVRIDHKVGKVLWDITEKKPVELPIDNIESLDFSPKGRYADIKGKSNQGQAETVLWDLKEGKTVDLPVDTIESLEFSADDRYVRIDSETDPLLWNFNTQESISLLVADTEQWEFSPDGQSIAMLSGGTVFWKHLDIQQYKTYNSLGGNFKWIDFSPNSRYLLYGKDSKVRRLDIQSIRPGSAETSELPLDGVEEVLPLPTDQCAHPDHHYVGIHGKGTVKFWDIETGNETQPLSIGQNRAAGLCFSVDSQRVSIMFDNGTVGVWDLETRQEMGRSFDGFCQASNCVDELRFSPKGNVIVTDRHVWDFYQGQTTLRPPKNIKKIQLSPELHYVMVHSDLDESETDVSVWKIETQERTRLPIDNAESIKIDDVSFSDKGRYMAINTTSEGQLWDVEKGEVLSFPSDDINYLRVSPNGQLVALETNDGVEIWDLESQQPKISPSGEKLSRGRATFSPNGRYLTLNQHPKHLNQTPDQLKPTLMLWDIENGEELLIEDIESIQSLSFSRDAHYVSLATASGKHVLWDTKKQTEVDLPVDKIASLTFRADGDYVAIKRQDDELEILWDLKKRKTVDLPIKNVEQILFDANDHSYMMLKSPAQTVLWDFKNDKEYDWSEAELSIIPTSQFSVSPDGQLLALKNEGAIVTWDIAKKIEIASTPSDSHSGEAGFGFSPDSDFLISHNQNSLHVMLVKPDTLIEDACDHLPHNLSQQKWKQYFRDELEKKAKDYQPTCDDLRDPDDYEAGT